MAVYKRDLIDVNLETGNIYRSWLKHSIGYMDQKADHFGVRVYRNGEPVNLTGISIQGVFMPPQGSPIAITSGNIVSGNVAEVVLPQACYNYDGQFSLAIKLVDSSNSVTGTVRIVDGMVDNTHASGTVAPTSAVPTYQEVLSTYEQAIAAINKTVRFDATQSLTDTQKATARANIDAASVGTANELAMDIGALAEGFANESYMDLGNKYMPFRRGYYSTPAVGSTSSYNSNSQYFYALVMCQPGDVLSAHVYGNSTVYAWAFLDSSLKVLSRGGTGEFSGTQVAPASTSYALVNVDISHMSTGFYACMGGTATKDKIARVANNLVMNVGALSEGDANVSYIDLGHKWMSFLHGYYSTPAVGSMSSYHEDDAYFYALVACQQGDVLHAHVCGGAADTAASWAFLDSSLKVVQKATTNNLDFNSTVTAPANTAFALVNNKLSNLASGYYAYVGGDPVKDKLDLIVIATTAETQQIITDYEG